MRRIGAGARVGFMGVALVAGCSVTSDASPTDSASTSGGASASSPPSDGSIKAAHVCGTRETLTNGSGKSVEFESADGVGVNDVGTAYSTLAGGASSSDYDEYTEVAQASVFCRVKHIRSCSSARAMTVITRCEMSHSIERGGLRGGLVRSFPMEVAEHGTEVDE